MFKSSRHMSGNTHRNEPYSKGQLLAKKFFGSHGQFSSAGLFRVKKIGKKSSFWPVTCLKVVLWGHLVIWNVIFHIFFVIVWDLWHYAVYSHNKMWLNALWNIQECHWVKHAFLVLFLVSCGHLVTQNMIVHILVMICWCLWHFENSSYEKVWLNWHILKFRTLPFEDGRT